MKTTRHRVEQHRTVWTYDGFKHTSPKLWTDEPQAELNQSQLRASGADLRVAVTQETIYPLVSRQRRKRRGTAPRNIFRLRAPTWTCGWWLDLCFGLQPSGNNELWTTSTCFLSKNNNNARTASLARNLTRGRCGNNTPGNTENIVKSRTVFPKNFFWLAPPFLTNKFLSPPYQWRAEVWWCPGRLLDCMPPNKC